MLYGDQQSIRGVWVQAWRKYRAGEELEPMERQIVAIVAEHREYHAVLERGATDADYTPEGGASNPFLHMGLHLAVREQIATDRPPGIAAAWRSLAGRYPDEHAAEHAVSQCLAESLWQAQRDARPPDEAAYLAALRRLGPPGAGR